MGVIQTIARGARRPKSPFRGRLDLFFEAEISIAVSRKSSLHTLCELSVTNSFPGIRSRHLRTQTASYFVELIEICTEAEHHEPELFELLQRAFRFLSEHEPNQRAIAHFETELARIAEHQRAFFLLQQEMIVFRCDKTGRLGAQLARHAEMDGDPHSARELKRHLFAARF